MMHLSRTIAHALRHEPWLYELDLDEEGWVETATLLTALRDQCREWRALTEQDLVKVIENSDKRRFELRDGRIRALYGHSTPQKLQKVPAVPPVELYHGTAPKTAKLILVEGLRPMRRQYVHLSADWDAAYQAGKRKAKDPVIFCIAAAKAHATGIAFYRGNERIWLADHIPAMYISEALAP